MSLPEIQPSQVTFLLHYLLPLDPQHGIPNHLISATLLHRHHFLAITPQDAAAYLSWPEEDAQAVATLLQSTPPPQDDHPVSYDVRYTSTGDCTYAHVHIPTDAPGVRLVFQWERGATWKYHDAKLMPFPPNATPSPPHLELDNASASGYYQEDEADDYWNAYDDPEPPQRREPVALTSEDDYWARYSSVHGTADSTIPSPRPLPRDAQQFHPYDDDDYPNDKQEIYTMPTSVPSWSPQALELRLSNLSPRPSISASPAGHGPGIVITDADADEASVSNSNLDLTSESEAPSSATRADSTTTHVDMLGLCLESELDPDSEMVIKQDGLKDVVRGLYALWTPGPTPQDNVDKKVAFMRAVEEALLTL